MTKGVTMTEAVSARLELIKPAAGYFTDLKAVYQLRPASDSAPMPYALLAWELDASEERGLRDAKRGRTYVVQGVFSKSATLSELERFHFDVLRALGYGAAEFERPIPGQIVSDSAELEPAADGSTKQRITITLEARYAESYA